MPDTLATTERLGQAMRFRVTIDGLDLGAWNSCDGLGFKVSVQRWKEGGTNTYLPFLAGRVEYTDVKLTRVVTADGNARMAAFLARMATDFKPSSGSVELLDAHGDRVAVWSLRRAYPVGYTGPKLDTSGSKIATETLTFVHEGFLPV